MRKLRIDEGRRSNLREELIPQEERTDERVESEATPLDLQPSHGRRMDRRAGYRTRS